VHQAALLSFPPHRVGFILMARGAHLYLWRVGHRIVYAVETLRRLIYLFLTRVRVLSCHFGFFSWHIYWCSEPPIPETHPVQRCPLWLVVTIVASVLIAGVPTVMSARR
jgi:hypothetical protein